MDVTCTLELVERSLAGEWGAFEDLITPLWSRLPAGLRRANRDEAENAVQEATVKAWLKLGSFRTGADPRPWFLTIVANVVSRDVRGR